MVFEGDGLAGRCLLCIITSRLRILLLLRELDSLLPNRRLLKPPGRVQLLRGLRRRQNSLRDALELEELFGPTEQVVFLFLQFLVAERVDIHNHARVLAAQRAGLIDLREAFHAFVLIVGLVG